MNRIEQLKLAISKVKKDVAMYKMKLVNLSSFVKTGERELAKYETELAELNKAKTGRVKIGDDLSEVKNLFLVKSSGNIQTWVVMSTATLEKLAGRITQGRTFYDRPTAELFALREAAEFKIWCEFGDEVAVIPFSIGWVAKGVPIMVANNSDITQISIEDFLDTLSPEEINSIRSD